MALPAAASSGTAALTLLVGVVICTVVVAVTGEYVPVPPGIPWCSLTEYTAADVFASDIDRVLEALVAMDFVTIPKLDGDVFSPPDRNTALAFGLRECNEDTVDTCKSCFEDAHSQLVNGCRNYYRVGGQIRLDICYIRYEIYDFIRPKT